MGLWKSAVENLKGDPSAGLGGIAILAGLVLLAAGQGPWIALGFPGTIFGLYLLKGLFDNHHQRRMAEFEVQKIEAERGNLMRNKTQKALEKRRSGNGTD